MSDLTRHVEDYLSLRRALGFKLKREEKFLKDNYMIEFVRTK